MSLDEEGTSEHYRQKTFLLNQTEQDLNRLKHLHERLEDSCHSEQQNQSRIEDISTFPLNQVHTKKSQIDNEHYYQTEQCSNNQSKLSQKNKGTLNKSFTQSHLYSRNKLEEFEIISKSPTQKVINVQLNDLKQEIQREENNLVNKSSNSFISKLRDQKLTSKKTNSKPSTAFDIKKMFFIKRGVVNFFKNKTLSGRNYLLKNNKIKQFINDQASIDDQIQQSWIKLQIENLFGHIIACMYYLTGKIELEFLNNDTTWFDESIGSDGTWWKLYLQAFYWSLTLMATGSNEARTTLQIFFTSFIMCFTTIIFGYFISVIGIILVQMDEEEDNKRRDINIINDFMRRRNISKNLQRRVNLDLEYYYKKNFKKKQIENQLVLSKISQHLNEQILREYYGIIIQKISFLNQNFSEQSINQLCLTMEEVQYLPNQIIYDENDHDDFSLVYIQSGEVELIQTTSKDNHNNHIIDTIKQNSILGQENFFTGTLRSCRARAKTFTSAIKISRNKFIEIIKNNESEYEKFLFIKDKILLYQNYDTIKISCYICNKFSHFTGDCPLVHFDKNESYNKMGYLQKVKQQRSPYKRSKQKSQNTLLLITKINYATQQLISNQNFDGFAQENEVSEVSTESPFCEEGEISQELSKGQEEIKKSDENILSKDLSPTVNKNELLFNKQEDEKEEVQEQEQGQEELDLLQISNKDSLQKNLNICSPLKLKKEYSKENQLKPLQIQQTISEEYNFDSKQKKQNEKQMSLSSLKHISKLDMFQQQSYLEQMASSPLAIQSPSKRMINRIQKRNSTNLAENRRNATRLQTAIQFKSILDIEESNNKFRKDLILWNFDLQKDYQIYFPEGNKLFRIQQQNAQLKKKQKKQLKKQNKKQLIF
ncbi:cation channel family protein (macronuclear) [Tetrahymena thermophila SB210]|uniref:Cation channel family protein n=1 Tax=Tetrahymena thermophila (strain SB210) TaxID=312017 RepID=W7X1D7_TETTS|nr:cation channel family protein [Tetrahymena thermophila SB210]EWS73045.1 cation channel family protein [Tetrahymena thermophila SB210]|eukprot:XP_012654442.1 cation channel family protein [Tetrahymena thermophila SB210]